MIELKFRTEKVSEHITRIYAFSSELMYLVEGNKEAALIDSGSGIGFVRPLIEELTKKPLKVLLTHGHVDHAMGASEFPAESVYISQKDAYIYYETKTFRVAKKAQTAPIKFFVGFFLNLTGRLRWLLVLPSQVLLIF